MEVGSAAASCAASAAPPPEDEASHAEEPVAGSTVPADEAVGDAGKHKKQRAGPRKRRPKKPKQVIPEPHDDDTALTEASSPEKDTVSRATVKPQSLCVSASPSAPVLRPMNRENVSKSPSALPLSTTQLASPPALGLDPLKGSPSRNPMGLADAENGFAGQNMIPIYAAGRLPPSDDDSERTEREYWTQWVIEAAEKERTRRLNVLRQLQQEEEEEVRRRRSWAIAAIEKEQEAMMREMFLDNMKNTQWFQSTISRFSEDYEVVCPNSWFGCTFSCMLKDLEKHLESCVYRQVPDRLDQAGEDSSVDLYSYDIVCPNALLGCKAVCSRENLAEHLATCPVNGKSREKEWEERLEWRRNVILATEQERERRIHEASVSEASGLSFGHLQRLYEEQTAMMQVVLHDEMVDFYQHKQQEARDMRPWVEQALEKVNREIRALWGDSAYVEGYGSFTTQLYGASSDVDLVVFGVAEEHQVSCQHCVSMFAAHLQASKSADFVDISALTRASIPLVKVVVVLDCGGEAEGSSEHSVLRIPFDITFDEPDGVWHNGVASASLVNTLATHFYGLRELALVLKHFLVKRSLNDPYVGGLSSYGLLLMIVYILLEQGAFLSSVDAEHLVGCDHDIQASDVRVGKGCNDDTKRPVRCHEQHRKGEQVAKEIIRQSIVKQQRRQQYGATEKMEPKKKRPGLPAILMGDNEHEAKPYLLGKLLMDFLHFFGNDFRQNVDQISVLNRDDIDDPDILEMTLAMPSVGYTSGSESARSVNASPSNSSASPLQRSPTTSFLSLDPMVSPPPSQNGVFLIQDPLQLNNNVGKSCYRVSQVFRDFSDFLSFLTALIVRGSVMTTGKKKKKVSNQDDSGTVQTNGSVTPPLSSSPVSETRTYRILMSVFEMKSREKRASLDFAERSKESGG